MMNCREASRLASERLDRKLSVRERLAFRFHLMMCRTCTRYARQLRFVTTAVAAQQSREPGSTRDDGLPEAARARIAARLREEADDSTSRPSPPSE